MNVGEVGGGGSGAEGGGMPPLPYRFLQSSMELVGDIGVSVRGSRGRDDRRVLLAVTV